MHEIFEVNYEPLILNNLHEGYYETLKVFWGMSIFIWINLLVDEGILNENIYIIYSPARFTYVSGAIVIVVSSFMSWPIPIFPNILFSS